MQFFSGSDERMRMWSGGTLSVPIGIELGNGFNGNSANTLDDYEEGYFTPTIYTGADNGSGGSVPFAIQAGRYIKIGRKVHCDIYLRFANGAPLVMEPMLRSTWFTICNCQ